MNKVRRPTALADRIAVLLSAVCLVQCLGLPVVVAVGPPIASALLSDRAFHGVLLLIVLPTSVWALTRGCRNHGHTTIGATGALGLTILIVVGVLGHDMLGETGERVATSLGSALVAVAHVMNVRRMRAIA